MNENHQPAPHLRKFKDNLSFEKRKFRIPVSNRVLKKRKIQGKFVNFPG